MNLTRLLAPAGLLLLGALSLAGGLSRPADQPLGSGQAADMEDLLQRFRTQGIHLDLKRGFAALPVTMHVRDDLLEYLLVGAGGASHETLLSTPVTPSVLNTALLLLGVEPGRNARWTPRDDAEGEGGPTYEVQLPSGDGFYLYLGWREGDESFVYRIEDLLRNLKTGRSMQRHAWVYLGSRMIRLHDGGGKGEGDEVFAADVESNLINLAFFPEGNTLISAAVEDCRLQTIWLPNAWLLPPRGSELRLFLARTRLRAAREDIVALLPELRPADSGEESR